MFSDELSAIQRYKGLHANIDKAVEFLAKNDLNQLELGRVEIDGEEVFLFVQENQLNQEPTDVFEYHKSYMDIHIIQSGREVLRYGRQVERETQAFEGDIGFVTCQKSYGFDLDGSNFIAFYPEEPHQPNQYAGEQPTVRKYVFKIKID